jgi:hypothetical protein
VFQPKGVELRMKEAKKKKRGMERTTERKQEKWKERMQQEK